MPDIDISQRVPRVGLVTDNLPEQSSQGFVTYALNCINSSFDGQAVNYQNEEGDVFCMILPEGYKVIGFENITQLDQVWYLITNPSTGFSMIGYVQSDNCSFISVIDDSVPGSDLLGFDINFPVHQIVVKTTNCSTQLYWTDKHKERRFIDLQNLPWKTGTTNQLDNNKIAVQPRFSTPQIEIGEIGVGGTLIEGDYQFCTQYANIRSEGLTSFYSVSNPVRIFLDNKMSLNFNELTNKSITLTITNLDTTGLYDHINLAVIKTINAAISVELVGTFSIQNTTKDYVYTGAEQSNSNIKLTLADIESQNDYYDLAGTVTQADHRIIWADLVREDDIAYQKIFNQVKVQWATSQVPTGQRIGYYDGTVCAKVEGYFRDEVYPLEMCLILTNGKETTRQHIPGRAPTGSDLAPVPVNSDTNAIELGTCPPGFLPRWKVYNTGSNLGALIGASDPCTGVKPWEHGEMAYWESTELYPSNIDIWGTLANQPVRHHKFPDSIITHIHDQNPFAPGSDNYLRYNHNVYPIGFLIDIQSLWYAIQSSTDLTPEQKSQIQGFKVMRGDRAGNDSVIAKGMLYNCGKYNKGGTDYYYPNYPLNDVNPDPFISSQPVPDKSGNNSQHRLNDFQQNRFTFHSPDTHFYQASGFDESFLKLETAEWGSCKSHFVQVQKNAGEKILTPVAMEVALVGGLIASIGANVNYQGGSTTTVTVSPAVNFNNFFPSFNNMMEVIEKLTPYYNYGWQYNGVGYYGNYTAIPNDIGNKIRFINYGGYLADGLNGTFGDDHSFNNTERETSVYLSVNENLPYTHTQPGLNIPIDTSRQLASQTNNCGQSIPFFENISSYYATIKRDIVNQYGEIFSYRTIDTGYNAKLNQTRYDPAIVYGGDCFINRFALKIKHPFYLKTTVEQRDGSDIDYNQDALSNTNTGNVGYPIWYYSTTNKTFTLSAFTSGQITNLTNLFTTPGGVILTFLSIGLIPLAECVAIIGGLIIDGFFSTAGLKITNLDCYDGNRLNEHGEAYLYAYGIPYYFCESQVNVDMRQAYNNTIGNFFPNMGADIPDEWVQEINTPIAADNTYTYNKTYSKQNHETAFTLLRPDWSPNQLCYTNYNNRTIWSEQSHQEESKNNWQVYRPANLYDFPKNFGSLISIDALDSREVMVRYENHTQIYNALSTIQTTGLTAVMGSGDLFSGSQPLDFTMTDTGNMGTQHKFLLSTEFGHVFTDALRGQVILLRGHAPEELSSAKYLNSKWFSNNLPFQILKAFPGYPIDNNFNGIGLHGTYDAFYKRLIITKKDYKVINPGLKFNGTDFYIDGPTIPGYSTGGSTVIPGAMSCCPDGYQISPFPLEGNCQRYSASPNLPMYVGYIKCPDTVIDTTTTVPPETEHIIVPLGSADYFCDNSWTISYSFISNTWISWHSYIPDFYVAYPNYFQAGYNSGNFANVWDHNSTFSTFTTYRGVQYPYMLEYPFSFNELDQQLQSISDYCTALKYSSFDQSTEPNDIIYFNKCTIYNTNQCTGTLVLVPKDYGSMKQYRQYPQYNNNTTSILVVKDNSMYNINMIWDHVIDPSQPIWRDICGATLGDKVLSDQNLDYGVRSFRKYPISSKNCKVRLTLDNQFQYKLISRFLLLQHNNDYI